MADRGPLLLTGVTGFIGSHVARRFFREGWSVIGVDRTAADPQVAACLSSFHRLQLPDPAFRTLLGESRPHLCIHCAGSASVPQSFADVRADFYDNTVLTFEVLNALRLGAPQCRFVFLSSAAVYGNPVSLPADEGQPPAPLSPYGFHKYQCEQLCREFCDVYGLPTASARVFSAYGPGLRRQVIWDICQKASSQQSILLQGTGSESRDFIHVADIADALMVVATAAPMHGEVYNVGSGRETTIAELAHMVISALGSNSQAGFDGKVPPGTPLNWRADMSRLQGLGFHPSVSLGEGIGSVVSWFRSQSRST